MRVLIIGDSFVEGVGAKRNFGWAQMIKKSRVNWEVLISGIGGDNINKINNRLDVFEGESFDLIILCCGLNDSRYRPSKQSNEVEKNDFLHGLDRFVDFFRLHTTNANFVIIGLSKVDESLACPYKDDKYYINGNIDLYNSLLLDFAVKIDASFIEVPDLSSIEESLSDGLHPSDKGHQLIYSNFKEKYIEA